MPQLAKSVGQSFLRHFFFLFFFFFVEPHGIHKPFIPAPTNLIPTQSRLVQIDRVEEPVYLRESPRILRHVRNTSVRDTTAARLATPRVRVDIAPTEIRVDDDGLVLEITAHVTPTIRLLEVRGRRAPGLRIRGPCGDIRRHRGARPRPDAQAVGLYVGRVDAASCGVESGTVGLGVPSGAAAVPV